jgi:hypothetical protein
LSLVTTALPSGIEFVQIANKQVPVLQKEIKRLKSLSNPTIKQQKWLLGLERHVIKAKALTALHKSLA